jgi:hypothetical protein
LATSVTLRYTRAMSAGELTQRIVDRQPKNRARLAALQDDLRAVIDGRAHLLALMHNIGLLESGYEVMKTPDGSPFLDEQGLTQLRQLSQERVAAIRVANQDRMKLLGKVLPDLKQVEMTDAGGGSLLAPLSRAEMIQRLMLFAQQAEAESAPEEPADCLS